MAPQARVGRIDRPNTTLTLDALAFGHDESRTHHLCAGDGYFTESSHLRGRVLVWMGVSEPVLTSTASIR